jgi:mRNA-degrading endonuclease toxin of MazEF toxin-antitoxin module
MVAKKYIPERGDIVWLDFTPQMGHVNHKSKT